MLFIDLICALRSICPKLELFNCFCHKRVSAQSALHLISILLIRVTIYKTYVSQLSIFKIKLATFFISQE